MKKEATLTSLRKHTGLVLFCRCKMPWSPALPQALFTSPSLSTTTPVAIGSFVGYLVNREHLPTSVS
jgi:hypothetical protein